MRLHPTIEYMEIRSGIIGYPDFRFIRGKVYTMTGGEVAAPFYFKPFHLDPAYPFACLNVPYFITQDAIQVDITILIV